MMLIGVEIDLRGLWALRISFGLPIRPAIRSEASTSEMFCSLARLVIDNFTQPTNRATIFETETHRTTGAKHETRQQTRQYKCLALRHYPT